MKNILFWDLSHTPLEESAGSGVTGPGRLRTLPALMRAHDIRQSVLFALPGMRLKLEELWMRWQQEDPGCAIGVEYLPATDWSGAVLRELLRRHLSGPEECRAWCFLDHDASSHEAFRQALDALSAELEHPVVWIDTHLRSAPAENYLTPSLEDEDPGHWSIFEKPKVFNASPSCAVSGLPKAG